MNEGGWGGFETGKTKKDASSALPLFFFGFRSLCSLLKEKGKKTLDVRKGFATLELIALANSSLSPARPSWNPP